MGGPTFFYQISDFLSCGVVYLYNALLAWRLQRFALNLMMPASSLPPLDRVRPSNTCCMHSFML